MLGLFFPSVETSDAQGDRLGPWQPPQVHTGSAGRVGLSFTPMGVGGPRLPSSPPLLFQTQVHLTIYHSPFAASEYEPAVASCPSPLAASEHRPGSNGHGSLAIREHLSEASTRYSVAAGNCDELQPIQIQSCDELQRKITTAPS